MTRHTPANEGYQRILIATDFSAYGAAALKQGEWLARQTKAKVTVAHSLRDLHWAVTSGSSWSKQFEDLDREARQDSEMKLRRLIANMDAVDLDVKVATLQGEPYLAITRAVQQEGYDLVLAGTRGMAAWEQFFIGSTAKRLIRKCPASVWIVKAEHVGPPKAVLAATDFSEVSRRAVLEGLSIANQASAEFHLLHVIDSMDVPEDIISRIPQGSSLRRGLKKGAEDHFDAFVESLGAAPDQVRRHLTWGTPWREVGRLAQHLSIDLIALGTVGRSGVKGLLLGNTAEKVLDTCNCSMLTVKPADFVSPIIA